MKARLLFHQGPMAGRVIEVDEPREVIESYIDTGWCEYAEPEPVVVVEPEPEKEPEAKAAKPPRKRAKKKTSKARAKKPETPEG